uniref:Uncharacterized protein n=1 Tax=Oryza glumipatula TaxID=40148 RepID=A0A0D9YCZ2_9ORYZ
MASLRALPLLVLGMALCALALFPFVASVSRDLRHHPAGFVIGGRGLGMEISGFVVNGPQKSHC